MSHSLYFPSNVYFSYTYKNVLWLSPNFENKISKWRLWKVEPHLLESGLAAPGRLTYCVAPDQVITVKGRPEGDSLPQSHTLALHEARVLGTDRLCVGL